jgi:nucleoid DNA-binding protein
MEDFRRKVLKLDKPRVHKIRESLGVYDAYKYIRKNKWFNIPRPLTEHEFYSIIRQVNNYFADALVNGEEIKLPCRMGSFELRKMAASFTFENGKLKTNLPIDWDRTLKLWAEDKEAFKQKTLLKIEEKEIFKVFYNKKNATYINKSFYTFDVNRDIKKRLVKQIKNRAIDAFKL